ncbi:pentatricopeptide repeat-containing protein At2g13600 isoform X2 [Cryptomeria japonica]|uniref:pentatricopeptide repeat-containing protein At2g13600 isoform X2 n=1 Tax=Cryptomeria japonica TaxID=3369 RepID=UPI0027DA4E3C|nr:pentatricopeptide repeat-containing protein At2g13600 isoform X2 [Cryptomeria japonica]
MPMPFATSHNLNLTALCKEARLKAALHSLLTTHNPTVNASTYLQLLQARISKKFLSEGKQIHSHINEREFEFATHNFLQNTLIRMYDNCGSLVDARKVFDQMTEHDIFSWNIIIAAYRRHGDPHETLRVFQRMQPTGFQPDQFTFASILPACAKMNSLEQGMIIHQRIIDSGFLSDDVVGNALVDMYAKCGSIQKARELFEKMPQKNVVSWNAMIAGYTQNGPLDRAIRLFEKMPQRNVVSWNAIIAGYAQNSFVEEALETFKKMQSTGVKPITTTFGSVLTACAKMEALEQGMDIHQNIMKRGFLSDVLIINALVDMYAKCGSIHKACELFDKMPQRDVISWTSLIAGCLQNGVVEKALETFKQMQLGGVKPNSTTFASILPACARMGALDQGYAQNGLVEKALEAFTQMQLAGIKPNSTTFASILPACAKMGAVEQGMDIHQSIIERGFMSDLVVANALIDMYAKCGIIHKAREVFDKMPQKNVISWNAVISGYTQNGCVEKALGTFKQMQSAGVKPDSTTFVCILPACAKMGALEQGTDIHQSIMEMNILLGVAVANALVDMYAKCASIQKARELFDQMPQRNVISWTAMIAGYAQNGFCKDALSLFESMKLSRTHPDHVSFSCILLACSHAGLVDEGCKYFNLISDSYRITPTIDHYVCMVDLLGRAGYLEETLNFIIKMPIKPVVIVWLCLLGNCRAHKNIRLGLFTATLLFELDPKNTATYILLSNIYAEMGYWSEVQMVRKLMKDRGIQKIPGCSWIEIHKVVHAFCVGDKSQPQT